jgi:redox-sensitive bicupin YhaK (pirin superfamily)
MSGPVTAADTSDASTPDVPEPHPALELSDSRTATVGKMTVRRALPRRTRRTVGAWCFADHMGPAAATENEGLDIGPHPHIELQTVTLAPGRDDPASGQPRLRAAHRAGQLNLSTSGVGIAHAEETSGTYVGQLHGIQLWVALPESTRHGASAFEHHAELPRLDLDGAVATVLMGELDDAVSPARTDTPLVGVDLALRPGARTLPTAWEYALVVLEGSVLVDGQAVAPGKLAYLGEGRDELGLQVRGPTRAMLLGGEPFESPIVMWWSGLSNLSVGRSREEIAVAYKDWDGGTDRFGRVASPPARIPVEAPAWLVAG